MQNYASKLGIEIVEVKYILRLSKSNIKNYLFQPWYKTGIDTSFGSPNGERGNGPIIPILSGKPNDPFITFDPDLMLPLTNKAKLAINYLKQRLLETKQSVLLNPGDLLDFGNRKIDKITKVKGVKIKIK